MSDLIRRLDAIKTIRNAPISYNPLNMLLIADVIERIGTLPTIGSENRKSAYLIDPNPFGECSNCGKLIDIRDNYNYCPYCGLKLEE